MPALPTVTAFSHIHMRDLHLSPSQDATRVFRLSWHHHDGCYDQGYISTIELLRAEEIWDREQAPTQTASTRRCSDQAAEGRRTGSALRLDREARCPAGGRKSDYSIYAKVLDHIVFPAASNLGFASMTIDGVLCHSLKVELSLLTRNHASDGQDLALDSAKARRLRPDGGPVRLSA
jgi:hypothetical protein